MLRLGTRLAVMQVMVHSDGHDEPVAHATGTYSIPPPPGRVTRMTLNPGNSNSAADFLMHEDASDHHHRDFGHPAGGDGHLHASGGYDRAFTIAWLSIWASSY